MVRSLLIMLCLIIGINICYASTDDIATGIEHYKNGKYEDCITTMKSVVKNDPTIGIGYYYLGLAYSKTGKKLLAIQNYNKVINLNSDKTLTELAKQGKNLVGGKNVTAIETQLEDIEEEYNPIFNDSSTSAKTDTPKELEAGTTKVIKASDYANKTTHQQNNNAQPTNDEIVNAIRTLQKAGLLQNGVSGLTGNVTPNQMPVDSRTQQMQSILMMMNNNNGNNNGMMNMMPYMNNGGKIDPQLMQMMLMNQMMPNFSGGNNNGNGY